MNDKYINRGSNESLFCLNNDNLEKFNIFIYIH